MAVARHLEHDADGGHGVRRAAAVVVLLAAVAVAPPAAARRLRCDGAFARSCVRVLYRCFDGRGACTRDLSQLFPANTATDCWANGTRATLTGVLAGTGTSTLTKANGKACLRGRTEGEGGGAMTITYTRGRKTWTIHRAVDGAFAVTCPNGTVETYDATTVAAGGCGPIADCAAGSCS